MRIKGRFKVWFEKVSGDPEMFSMESRLFNAVCFLSLFGLAATSLLDYLLKLPVLSFAMFLFFCLVSFIYYLSRIKNRLYYSVLLFAVFSNILFSFNFYYNSGLNGPTLLIFLLSFTFMLSVSPKHTFRFWMPLNICTVMILLFISYNSPDWIKDTYTDRESRFIDFAFSYALIVILIFCSIFFIRKSYHYEKELAEQRAKELSEMNETKNKLFSIVAHDLKSPIASLQNYLELFEAFNTTEEQRREMEKGLLSATKNTSEMLTNLLSWATAQMDGITAHIQELDIEETLHNTIEVQAVIAANKGIGFTTNIQPGTCVMADANMLELVVRNLINNAIKFSLPGGGILLEANVANNTCSISLTDSGIGIKPGSAGDLFSLKTKSTFGTHREKGVGLGLVLCKNYVELQNGEIWYKSSPGIGTTFYVNLPASPKNSTKKGVTAASKRYEWT